MRPSLLVLLLACTPEDTGTPEVEDTSSLPDEDGDGFRSDDDCNDADHAVNPAAVEVCDGRDNDCDDAIDEGLGTTFYQDLDGDGFGDPDTASLGCEGSGVENGDDCDDTDASVFPDAPEDCDSIDDDCDGVPDDGVVTTFYSDADGDGYGDVDAVVLACAPTDGIVLDATDCDDTSVESSPAGTEVCDERDNDCDGTVDDGVLLTFYADLDEDGWGDDRITQSACVEPTGYAEYAGDCDDDDPDYHPGADESDCDDPNDYNCDGSSGYADTDGDEWAACEECDDGDPAVSPDATERCNDIDDNCDGDIDESTAEDASTWYVDYDGDSYGSDRFVEVACDAPTDYVANADDCDDTDDAVNPDAIEACNDLDDDCDGATDEDDASDATTWFVDYDGDGYGSAKFTDTSCDAPADYVAAGDDCDDTEADVFPGATETCDATDNDCDGAIDDVPDADGDGWDACEDCDDSAATVSEDAEELCNGVDDDCDGTVDEDDASDAPTWYFDYDGDGYGTSAYATQACAAPAGYVATDDDCDDTDPDATPLDEDADGANACDDCDDTDAEVGPAATETCNGTDDDCDGEIDEDDASDASTWYIDYDGDGFGSTKLTQVACDAPAYHVDNAADCDDTDEDISPDGIEVCNYVDDDCDGSADEGTVAPPTWYLDDDADGYGDASSTTAACDAPSGYVADSSDCDDADGTISPSASETCDGVDDNCDGDIDEDDAIDVASWYYDGDGDGFGLSTMTDTGCDAPSGYVALGSDCDDSEDAVNPAADEECNSIDDDCDTDIDEYSTSGTSWYVDSDGDGYGGSSTTTTNTCTAPSGTSATTDDCDDGDSGVSPGATETCDSEDDDCDGTVDSASACGCTVDTYGGHTYLFCNTSVSWSTASSSCAGFGYHLATMNDSSENSWITSAVNSYMPSYDPWFGFNDRSSEGSWVWETGEGVSYTNWNSGEPNNSSDEDCAHLYNGGTWNDHQCSGLSTGYVCESY